jgi:hypothetical protein
MLKWLARWRIAKFERQFDYDAGYMREILEVAPGVMLKIGAIGGLAAYRREVPSAAWHAAHICQRMLNIEDSLAERVEFELSVDFVIRQ